jgi:dTDP-4-dehydrorhamnose reductase
MKILLLGGRGRVGTALRQVLPSLGEVQAPDRATLDLTRPDTWRDEVRRAAPDLIVLAAAYTAVDRAESQPDLAWAVNAEAPGVLADLAARSGATLVHYSTDQVFDGRAAAPYDEADAPGPLNTYGRSKWAGEQRIRDSGCRHLIFRTTWVHAPQGPSFAHLVLQLAATQDQMQVVADEVGVPTPAGWLAQVTVQALRRLERSPELSGTWHGVPDGAVSRLGYAAEVLRQAHARGWPLRLRPEGLQPVSSASFPAAAARPLNAQLDNRRLKAALGISFPTWQAGVTDLMESLPGPSAPNP